MASASSKYLKVGIENALASTLGCVLGCRNEVERTGMQVARNRLSTIDMPLDIAGWIII